MKAKRQMVKMSCGHTVLLTKEESARAADGGGSTMECKKCPWNAPLRRVVERSWVSTADAAQ